MAAQSLPAFVLIQPSCKISTSSSQAQNDITKTNPVKASMMNTEKTLAQAAQEMLDAIKVLSKGIDWSNPVFAGVALAHANLHDALAQTEAVSNGKH